LTGVHSLSRELTAKRLEFLKEIVPGLRSVVAFYNPGNSVSRANARLAREAARKLGVQLIARHVGSAEELRLSLQGLYFQITPALVISQSDLIIDAARAKKLPTMFGESAIVTRGALASSRRPSVPWRTGSSSSRPSVACPPAS
jgi:putative ABC transport system substrate-binding protein